MYGTSFLSEDIDFGNFAAIEEVIQEKVGKRNFENSN